MKSPVYLITGPSGSGKTAVADYLTEHGFEAMDADSTQGLCYFADKNNKPVPYPQGADAKWWETHNYVWELSRLARIIKTRQEVEGPLFMCGNAGNITKAADMFDKIFYLDIPEKIMLGRIAESKKDLSFGQRVDEREQLVRWAAPFKAQMEELGAITVDATKSVKTVAQTIIDATGAIAKPKPEVIVPEV